MPSTSAPAPRAKWPRPACAPAASSTPARPPPCGCTPSNGRPDMATIDIKVPDIGDFKDVAVIEVLVKPGDAVKLEQSLITVESDKASMEIPSSAAGVVKELKVQVGDKVSRGSIVAVLSGSGPVAPPSSAVTQGAATSAAEDRARSAAPAPAPSAPPQPAP